MTTIRRRAAPAPRPRVLVLLDPAGAFAAVAARPMWGLAVVVVLAVAALPPLAFIARADVEAVVKKEITRSGRLEQIPADKRSEIITLGATAMKAALPVGALVKRSVWMTALSLLLFALLKGARPELKLSPVAGAVGLAMAPLLVHDVLAAATYLSRDAGELLVMDLTNPILSNPAAWLGLDSGHTVAGALLKGLDFFELWSCVLVGVGVNAVVGLRSRLPWAVAFGGHAAAIIVAAAGAAAS